MYLYHYYDKEIGPFRTLSEVPRGEANEILRNISNTKPHVQCAKRQLTYM